MSKTFPWYRHVLRWQRNGFKNVYPTWRSFHNLSNHGTTLLGKSCESWNSKKNLPNCEHHSLFPITLSHQARSSIKLTEDLDSNWTKTNLHGTGDTMRSWLQFLWLFVDVNITANLCFPDVKRASPSLIVTGSNFCWNYHLCKQNWSICLFSPPDPFSIRKLSSVQQLRWIRTATSWRAQQLIKNLLWTEKTGNPPRPLGTSWQSDSPSFCWPREAFESPIWVLCELVSLLTAKFEGCP